MTDKVPPFPGSTTGMQSWIERQSSDPDSVAISTSNKVAVFWDFENCPPPSGMPGYVVIENIRRVIHHFGHISQFKAYLEIKNETIPWHKSLRSELQSSGVSLTDCPHNGRKDAVDKMIMVDMLGFAIDQAPPATIVLISGDKDFVYALSTLRNRRYTVVLIVPNKGAPIILKSQASVILEWRYDVLNQNIWALQQQQVMQSSSSGASNSGSIRPSPVSSTYSDMESSPDAPSFKMTSEAGGSPLKSEITTIEELSSSHSEVSNDDKNANESDGLSIKTKKPSIIGSDDEYIGFCFSPKAPGYFDLLAEVLEKFRMAGETRPRRSKVGHELINKNPLLYHRASCANFKEYIDLACKEGIVTVGGQKGLAWISLNEDYRDKLF